MYVWYFHVDDGFYLRMEFEYFMLEQVDCYDSLTLFIKHVKKDDLMVSSFRI